MPAEMMSMPLQVTGDLAGCPTSPAAYKMRENPFRVQFKLDTLRSVIKPTLNQYVSVCMSAIPGVESVLTRLERGDDMMYVFIVTNEFDLALHDAIFSKEERIIDEFEMFSFEFRILTRRGSSVSDLLTVDESCDLVFARS